MIIKNGDLTIPTCTHPFSKHWKTLCGLAAWREKIFQGLENLPPFRVHEPFLTVTIYFGNYLSLRFQRVISGQTPSTLLNYFQAGM